MQTPKLKCSTKFCKNLTETEGTKFCKVCRKRQSRKRQSRERDPVAYSYRNLMDRAKQRCKPFSISLDYFRQFCYETDYIKGKGRNAKSFTVDCKINELGYVEGNLQILTLEANAIKGYKQLNYDWRTKEAWVYSVTGSKINVDIECPF